MEDIEVEKVSLPGAVENTLGQPVILQVQPNSLGGPRSTVHSEQRIEVDNDDLVGERSNLSQENKVADVAQAEVATRNAESPDKFLDIESHLIETLDEAQLKKQSVGINELPPAHEELIRGSSKVETDSNVRTIIEVQPVGPRLTQPTETYFINPRGNAELTSDAQVPDTTDEERIRLIAERLIDEIEEEAIEILLKKTSEKVVPKQNGECEASEEILSKTAASSVISDKTATQKANTEFKRIAGPVVQTSLEAEERKLFIDSLPHLELNTEASKLSTECKQEYYKSLRKYLHSYGEKPPIPLQTYRWEDLRRAKERGGYPWTHLYKRPLGPEEEPEIVLLLRKSQELRFTSESPKSLKRVRYDEQVLVKQTERYIQELEDEDEDEDEAENVNIEDDHQPASVEEDEFHSLRSDNISCISDSVLATGKPKRSNRLQFAKIRNFLRHRRKSNLAADTSSLPDTSAQASVSHSESDLAAKQIENSSHLIKGPEDKSWRTNPIMKKLRSMADRQKHRLNIKRITLKKNEKIILADQTKILNLKNSPKMERSEIPHFVEKQDSDDVLEIVELEESPSRKRITSLARCGDDTEIGPDNATATIQLPQSTIVEPDEIIDITKSENGLDMVTKPEVESITAVPPKKAPRLRREHLYEEIDKNNAIPSELADILNGVSVESLKKSLTKQDNIILNDLEDAAKTVPLDRMGSSEEEVVEGKPTAGLLAPISSIDSASSDEDRCKVQLATVTEETDTESTDKHSMETGDFIKVKSVMKREASPALSDKKVTFSHVEDEAEPHREDVELSEAAAVAISKNVKTIR